MAGYTIVFTSIKNIKIIKDEKNNLVEYYYELPEELFRGVGNYLHVLFFYKEESKKNIVEQFDEYIWNRIFFYEKNISARFDVIVVVTYSEFIQKLYKDFKELLNDDCCHLILADQAVDKKINLVIEMPLVVRQEKILIDIKNN